MRILTRWPGSFDQDVERALAAAEGGLRDGRPADVLATYKSDARLTLFVAVDGAGVVGCVGARVVDQCVHLQHMFVRADPRRRGIGRRLLTEVLVRHPLRLEADTNAEGAAFYRLLGFTVTPHRVGAAVRYRCALEGARPSKVRLAG